MTRDPQRPIVQVILDRKNPATDEQYRLSEWRERLEARRVIVQDYCIPDLVRMSRIEPLSADLVVVNWDALNGDPVCEADVSLRFFEVHGKPLLAKLMAKGGTLFCEFQTAYGAPCQASYDALFGKNEVTVLGRVLPVDVRSGKKAVPFDRYVRHPLVPPEQEIEGQEDGTKPLFSLDVSEDRRSILPSEHYPNSLWWGWFTSWRRDWIPLLCGALPPQLGASSKKPTAPVLLAKTIDRGLMVASTMAVARPRCTKLIDRLVDVDLTAVHAYHRRAMLRRNLGDGLWAVLTLVALAVIASGLWTVYASSNGVLTPFKLLLSVLSFGVLTLLPWLWHVYWNCVWSRPLGLGVLETVRAKLRSLADA